jgi:hypothetical protein
MNSRLLKFLQIFLFSVTALLAGCQRKETQTPPTPTAPAAPPSGGIVSAEKNSFDEVTAKLDKGGDLYVYMSTEKVLANLSQGLSRLSNSMANLPMPGASDGVARGFGFVDAFARDSGVEQISGLGASSIAREKGFYYSKVIVHHYAGKSDGLLWNAFGHAPHPLKELDMLPVSTAFANYSDLDVPLTWKTILAEINRLQIPGADKQLAALQDQFQAQTGLNLDDVLRSFGGGFGVILTLDETKKVSIPVPGNPIEIPEPALAIYAKVSNDVIFNRVDQVLASVPMIVKTDRPDLKSRTLNSPIPFLPITLSPTIAQSGGYLFVSSSSELVTEILDVQAGRKPGFKSTPEFKHLSQGIPLDGNNFSLLSEKFSRTLGQAAQTFVNSQPAMMGNQTAAFKNMFDTNQAAYLLTVGVNGPDGWESVANGNKSLNAMFLPIAAGTAGLLAAVAVPNFVRARTVSQENACINNLRLIDSAKQQWALEHNKKNSDVPTEADIRPYMGRTAEGEMPKCPEGGVYIIGAVGEKPRCSIPGHVLP